jgi:glycosyltransferase involved in cell wall biosynthesis
MKFSFIMPVWKGKYLREAIQSILNQTYHDFELVIVDDCSPEPIQSIVESMSTKNIHCRYYRNSENIGGHDLIAQWNHCLEYAQGEYIILATDDDFYEPLFLSTFNQLTYKYPQVDLFRSRLLQVNADNQILNIDSCYKEYLSQEEFTYHMLHDMKGGIPQYIFKRKTLQAHGGFVNFPKAWASDDATAIMMAEHGCVNSQEHLVRFR